jgi:hypothetical protein
VGGDVEGPGSLPEFDAVPKDEKFENDGELSKFAKKGAMVAIL